MRTIFSNTVEKISSEESELIFITGDLGFNVLEPLKIKLGKRFINAGVAEQSMVGMAAGMAANGHKVIVYSQSSFLVMRSLEQIRNDVCFHNLPVLFVGDGGGYEQGINGSSHHSIQDISLLSALPNIKVLAPSSNSDLESMLLNFVKNPSPTYIRLMQGSSINMGTPGTFRKIHELNSARLTVLGLGTSLNEIIDNQRFNEIKGIAEIFTCNMLPINILENIFNESLAKTKKLLVVEENVQEGGLSSQVALKILQSGIKLERFRNISAVGYPGNIYGSQKFHQVYSGLDSENIIEVIKEMSE